MILIDSFKISGLTYFPVRMPPDALVYCSSSRGVLEKGRISSEYESCIFRGVNGSTGAGSGEGVSSDDGRSWPGDLGAVCRRVSDHNVGVLMGIMLSAH